MTHKEYIKKIQNKDLMSNFFDKSYYNTSKKSTHLLNSFTLKKVRN